jgi:hypothetical protein
MDHLAPLLLDLGGPEPRRETGSMLLEETFAIDAVRIADHGYGPIANMRKHVSGNLRIIVHYVTLGQAVSGIHHLISVCDLDLDVSILCHSPPTLHSQVTLASPRQGRGRAATLTYKQTREIKNIKGEGPEPF